MDDAASTTRSTRAGACLRRTSALAAVVFAPLLLASAATAKPAGNGNGNGGGSSGPRVIEFADQQWLVKSSGRNTVGPGPNVFSDSSNHVWVDGQGRLHLRIARRRGVWRSAEIISLESFGHGTYEWTLDSPVNNFDPNVVLGLFTWSDEPDFAHREIDIEFSRWGNVANMNAQYVAQPYDVPGNTYGFDLPSLASSVHSFTWLTQSVLFESQSAAGAPLESWAYNAAVPPAGGENARMNLWLFQGQPPTDGRAVEVVISDFTFVPAL